MNNRNPNKILLIVYIMGALACLYGCEKPQYPNRQRNEKNMTCVLESVSSFHPYSMSKCYVFESDTKQRDTIQIIDTIYSDKGIMEYVNQWYIVVSSRLVDSNGISYQISTSCLGDTSNVTKCQWMTWINNGEQQVIYSAKEYSKLIPIDEFISTADTITMYNTDSSSRAFLKIIRHTGLTEFSLDGEEIWRLVE